MKVSLKWVQKFTDTDLLKEGLDELVNRVNTQLGAIDEIAEWGKRYEGIVAVKIVSCEKHPNADKLKICLVDDGGQVKEVPRNGDGHIQIVCGGPNARADIFAAWIPPGRIVPSSAGKDPFLLEAREIRGQLSNGMLASPSELGFSDEHEGILEISQDLSPHLGQQISELYDLDDVVLDIENKMFTHRPDLFGILGVARELSGIYGQKFTSPEWYLQANPEVFKQTAFEQLPVEFDNQAKDIVPRFTAIALSDIKVVPSPYWLQAGLIRVGIKPVNNVVDVTNYVMHITGQPLHAFDYDKLCQHGAPGLVARKAEEGETITLLGGKSIKITPGSPVIASTGGKPVALAGIMGGADTEVSDFTSNILIECANFDMYAIRRSAMAHGIFTDASTRFTKGQSPLQNDRALAYCIQLMSELANGKVASRLIDHSETDFTQKAVGINKDIINGRLGLNLEIQDIVNILDAVELQVEVKGGELKITPPFWRTDLKIKEDIIEEIGRLYGYHHLPDGLPLRDLSPTKLNGEFTLKHRIRQLLASFGANEVLTYSFVNAGLPTKSGQDENLAYGIRNALSPNLQYYRISLAPSLLERVHPNLKAGFGRFAIFEIGRAHIKNLDDEEKLPKELKRLSLVLCSNSKNTLQAQQGSAYFDAKHYLTSLFSELNIKGTTFNTLEHKKLSVDWQNASAMLDPSRSAQVTCGDEFIGVIGEPSSQVLKNYKLPNHCALFEIDLEALGKLSVKISTYKPLNKFPVAFQDISFKIEPQQNYQTLHSFIEAFLKQESANRSYGFELECIDIYESEDRKEKHLAFRISLWHPEKTLNDQEFNKLMDQLAESAKQNLNSQRI